jgi:hypothetical protein
MIIPITFPSPSTESNVDSPRLPPQLAKLGHDEFVLIELQGSLSVEGVATTRGQLVGTLRVDEASRSFYHSLAKSLGSDRRTLVVMCMLSGQAYADHRPPPT